MPERKPAKPGRSALRITGPKAPTPSGKTVTLAWPKSVTSIDPRPTNFTSIDSRVVTPVFGKYITRNGGFVEHLNRVRTLINTYAEKPATPRPLNIFLAAPPGGGKSFLIKQLISGFKEKDRFAFEEIYVASLDEVRDLHDVFQRVQSYNLEGKMPVVFFDEIDTKLDGHALYPKFLAPMWDGTFFVGKEKYFLGKSIFFFAGSTLSLEAVSAQILGRHKSKSVLPYDRYFDSWKRKFDKFSMSQQDKLFDFMDRIDAFVRIPPIDKKLLGQDLEQEYEDLAIMLVLKNFPNVKFIGKEALKTIRDELTKPNSMRKAEKMIFGARLVEPQSFDMRSMALAPPKTGESAWGIEVEQPKDVS